jgi:glyoxylase-like metal-dependent hydrolase (beta-lactamase superfamily II)
MPRPWSLPTRHAPASRAAPGAGLAGTGARRRATWRLGTAALVALFTGCATAPPPAAEVGSVLQRAEAALGSSSMTTLTFRGRGQRVAIGQAYEPEAPWPVQEMRVFSRAMHFDERAFREDYALMPPQGALADAAARPRRGVVLARQAFSWDVVDIDVAPAQTSWVARMHDLWLSTPQGALKAAERHGAEAGKRRVGWRQVDTLSFVVPNQFSATLLMEPDGRVSRIESVLPAPLRGDVAVLTEFFDYEQRGPLRFPRRIVQHQDGVKVLDVEVTSALLDAHVEITVPENVRMTGNAPAVQFLSDGVWVLGGGTHHSLLVEQAEQLVLVEAPLDDERGRALVAAARRLVNGKPLGALVVTQHRLDHLGGVRAVAATGATLLVGEGSRTWLQAMLARPLTRRADPLGESAEPPRVQGLPERWLLDDPRRPVEVHAVRGSAHARDLVMVWLPRERLLVQADAWTPYPPGEKPPVSPDPGAINLLANLERLGIVPLQIVSLHGGVLPLAELYRAAGRTPPR